MDLETKMDQKEKEALIEDFVAAYQEIKFSTDDNDCSDTFRILMSMKYHIARTESEEVAMTIMDHALDEYMDIMDKRMQFRPSDSEPITRKLNLKSGIKSVDDILQFVKPLPCQTENSENCKPEPADEDVESLMKKCFSEDISPRRRKKAPLRSNSSNIQYPISSQASTSFESFSSTTSEVSSTVDKRQEKKLKFMKLYERYHKNDESNHHKDKDDGDDLLQERDRRQMVPFTSAKSINVQQKKNNTNNSPNQNQPKKTLGGKTSVNNQYVNPFKREKEQANKPPSQEEPMEVEDERLKNIDPKMIELITNEIMDAKTLVTWDDVAGLEDAKRIIKEVIVFPMLRPDIFTGLRRPPKGMLLFGPPGTGKTLIGKCIASQSKSTFFSISASSLTSKWVGEGEKMVRALFAVARVHQPSVIFIDEIDSLLTQRSETEHESSRRIKTEFLVQLDGATTGDDDRILVIGATNRPQELDEAARRRFVKRLYVPLPEYEARKQIVHNLLAGEKHKLSENDIHEVATMTEHYSGADMTNLCKEASMGPIRSISFEQLENIRKEDVRCVTAEDFKHALSFVRPSVSQSDLGVYVRWDAIYGSGTAEKKTT